MNMQDATANPTVSATTNTKTKLSSTEFDHTVAPVSSSSVATFFDARTTFTSNSASILGAIVTSASASTETSGASTVASRETFDAAAKAVTVLWRSSSVVANALLAVLDESQHCKIQAK